MKYVRWLDIVLSWWCILLMGTLTAGIILSVFLRYVFGMTFVWAEAFITILFIGTSYFGAALGVRENEHISINLLTERLPSSWQKTVNIFVMVVIIVVQGVLFKTSLTWIQRVGSTRDVALDLPKSYFYLMVPISALLMIVYAVVKIILYLSDAEEENP